jgi:hypothetical protein
MLVSCTGNNLSGEAVGETAGQVFDNVLASQTVFGGRLASSQIPGLRIGEIIGRRVGQSLDEADRQRLGDATLRAAQTGERQTFQSKTGETVVAQKTGGTETVTAQSGQPERNCPQVEQQIIKKDGTVQKDLVPACEGAA